MPRISFGTEIADAAGSEDGHARVWDSESGSLLRKYDGLGTAINDAAFHPQDNIFAVCSFAADQPVLLFCNKGMCVYVIGVFYVRACACVFVGFYFFGFRFVFVFLFLFVFGLIRGFPH